MWVPRQLGSHHAERLKALGLELPPGDLSDPLAHPLGAVVSLGGCSASFVSAEGLVVTNHHCVTGSLQYSSKPGDNLLETGFLARTRGDERWNGPTGRVYVTQALTDVTDRVRANLEAVKGDEARHLELEKRTKALVAECEKATPNVRCDVASFFGGSEYLLVERLEILDVRLAYAPPRGIGNYGGEIDNWMWPRHTGDFGFYRAYVGPDGKPAAFAPQNVPYRPKRHLRISRTPLSAGDLVFVAGYPGQTYRLQTAAEVNEAVEWSYPRRIEMCQEYLALIDALGAKDEALRIKATPLARGLANALKYTEGSLEGLTKGGAAKLRTDAEARLVAYVSADPQRQARYGGVLDALAKIFAERERTREADASAWELGRMSDLLSAANTIVRMAEERPKADAARDPDYQERNWPRLEQAQQRLEKSYERTLDRELLILALDRAQRVAAKQRTPAVKIVTGKASPSRADIERAVEALYARTELESTERRLQLLRTGTSAALARSKDPFVQLAVKLRPLLRKKDAREDAYSGAMLVERPRYVGALREMAGGDLAPDANGTLRVTYGTVRGYTPKPGAARYRPFTVLSEVVAKATGKEPFDAPERLLAAAAAKKTHPYTDRRLGDVPVNFLADLDITGGNSGSATLDARGDLVGLAFDGNYEAMASDWVFMPAITRSIHVDVRYLLWVMDAVDGADHLLEEMGVTPAIEGPAAARRTAAGR